MRNKTFHILTFGCQMNARDSQWLKACLETRGFREDMPENSDIIVINTCSVREKPEQKVKSAIQRLSAIMPPNSFFCVAGCVAQQMGASLLNLSHRIRVVAGADGMANLPDAIMAVFENRDKEIILTNFCKGFLEKEKDSQTEISSFVTIMQGCDNFCSYCIVPFTKGRQKSRSKKAILGEIENRLKNGALEITLLGQNVNVWGKDNGEGSFRNLLDEIDALPGLKRLRYVTPHPADMDKESILAFSELTTLAPRLHLPLQSGSDRILKRMRRRHTAKDYLNLVEKLYSTNPSLALSTDLIVGFPGESEEDFRETLNMARACNFVSSFSFCYSDRPGTKAALMPDKVPSAVAHERLNRLQQLQEELTGKWLASKIGKQTAIIVEGTSAKGENYWQGRDEQGDIVNVSLPCPPASPIIEVRITEAKAHTLKGQPAE